jgi:hypothetical protein
VAPRLIGNSSQYGAASGGGKDEGERVNCGNALENMRQLMYMVLQFTLTLSDSYPAFFLLIATTSNKNF